MPVASISRIAPTAAPLARRAGDVAKVKAPSVALVALVPAPPAGLGGRRLNRPDPSFVTHLIATAELSPQTRMLRRAAIADVQAAYRSVARQNAMAGGHAGARTRLTA
jgi:hypothetical protein